MRLSDGIAKSTIRHSFFIMSLMTKSGRLACTTCFVCRLKSHRIVLTSFSIVVSGTCSYHFLFPLKPYFRQISQWIFCPTQSWHLLNSLCAILLHSLNRWFTVSSACLHIRHKLSSCVLSNFALIWFVLIPCSCAAKMSVSVSLLAPSTKPSPYFLASNGLCLS